MKTKVWAFALFFFSLVGHAGQVSQTIPYYGAEFYDLAAKAAENEDLITQLHKILRSSHRTVEGSFDEIISSCNDSNCYRHTSLGYDRARLFMMGDFYLVENNGEYALPDVYCSTLKSESQFPKDPPGPNRIPLGNVLNTEHTWPQSKFTGEFDREMQKSDLHHLFPTDSEMNSARGNNEFGDVVVETRKLKCSESRMGKASKGGPEVFEPPKQHRGNVARALFYFSVAYKLPISAQQEAALRAWNQLDPVDEEEFNRNNEIYKIQGNRNPFVDYPELATRIQNF